ncbi:SDR family NAD(P)-dependent oxidoreductase [Cyclobacterium sp. 1_MG-2023]|uniref:SDR family NAD(P)-dependent oxidoreductase n=1 Tax=Cyclobacterium sp. 1_MG-2023 TaxID=3062681 RepID=UPI0026E14339|nr:SDR family NAD(P)-dependent oxidoreductase [Cyclobacterium sp. 1_MG-2023]MDO6438579.1 SDR family NAD(P)-dependent oxidoreductase [Cyclobacterium sp. 1_MG-2023]
MRTILITGSTDGVGKLTALKLAKQGHQMLLHGRDSEKLADTILAIKDQTGNAKISGFVSDLSDFPSIEKMVVAISSEFNTIDVLINNAGVLISRIEQNQDNLDIRFAVNYLAPYLLTKGLLSLLKNSNSPRIINLSSAAQSTVSMDALAGKVQISSNAAYAQSKLALTMWSFALAKANPEIVTIAVNPGSLLNTKMALEAYGQHWSSADKGANILYELAISDQYADSNGKYFDNDIGSFSHAHNDAYNEEKIDQLISETSKILKK